jgi:hypothetical protein
MKTRISLASDRGIPLSNYGIIIAKINGILQRSVNPFTK